MIKAIVAYEAKGYEIAWKKSMGGFLFTGDEVLLPGLDKVVYNVRISCIMDIDCPMGE